MQYYAVLCVFTFHLVLIYYSGVEHQQADWVGIHEKICQLLIPLRSVRLSFLSSEEQRQKQEEELLEMRVSIAMYQCADLWIKYHW